MGVSKMKKDTKKKKNKKKDKSKLKTKWKTWMTVVSVIAGVLLISGAVVLGVFLSGGFEDKVIYQQGISYQLEDESLLNTQTNQIEVEDNFKITIPRTDSDATRLDVGLSFVGSRGSSEGLDEGWVGNGSIAVPEVVTLGIPFEVKLLNKTYQDENGEDYSWIAGGISTIRVAYEDISQSTFDIVIAVDVPVYKTFTYLANAQGEKIVDEGGNIVSTVIKEEEFYVMTEFYPRESKYLYSDDKKNISETDRRKKMSFYESKSEFITENFASSAADKNKISFTAGDRMAENVIINGYTFTDAKAQLDFLSSPDGAIDLPETYYQTSLGLLSTLPKHKESELKLTIGEASIDHFSVGRDGTEIDIDAGVTYQLFVQGDREHSPYLNANVYSTSGEVLDNLLKDIAIKFDVDGTDPVKNGSLLLEYGEKITIDGVDYYRPKLPSEENVKFSYWEITSRDIQNITVNVYLLVKDRSQLFAPANGEPQVKHLTLNAKEHIEQPIDWKDTEDITVLLKHDADGEIIRETINLSQYVINPENNIYRDAVYFAYFGDGDAVVLKETANAIIGETGYIEKYTGTYSTLSGNRYLFAIDGANLTLSQTSEFTIYYAIQNGEDEESGLYKIQTMCSTYKQIVCEEALYIDSVTSGIMDTGAIQEIGGEVSINQGGNSSIIISFTISPESLPVFKDEYQKGYLSLVLIDNEGNDISNYFVINDESLTTAEDKSGKLEYRVGARSSIQIDKKEGIIVYWFKLRYDNTEDEIEWEFNPDKTVVLYSPEAETVIIDVPAGDDEVLKQALNGVDVSQILNTFGKFETRITVDGQESFETIDSFIAALVGNNGAWIKITDQKGKTDTLAGQWRFQPVPNENNDPTIDNGVISISADGKSFSFKNTNGSKVILYIQSVDGKADLTYQGRRLEIVFEVRSQGITKIAYDKNEKTYQNTMGEKTTNISQADVHKFGAKGVDAQGTTINEIDLKKLIMFYTTSAEGEDQPYEYYSFRFNPQYYSPLVEDSVLLNLFGEDGMLTLYTGYPASTKVDFGLNTAINIRNTLSSLIDITKIVINKNFYVSHTLQFIIFDTIGAVNTTFNLVLNPNITVNYQNYGMGDTDDDVLYAGKENEFVMEDTFENKNEGSNGYFYSLFDDKKTYYILNQNGNYELIEYGQKPANAIGVFNPAGEDGQIQVGHIYFYDFWDKDETRRFDVYFRPEGKNSFAVNIQISFIVTKDILITDLENKFYVLNNQKNFITAYVSITRHIDNKPIQSLTLTYEFSEYLELNNAGYVVQNSQVILFDYNVKTIETTLNIIYEANGERTQLGEITVYIELYNSGEQDIYQLIASKLRKQRSVEEKEQPDLPMPTAQFQSIGEGEEQVDYIVVDLTEGTYWQFYEDANDDKYNTDNGIGEGWPINPVPSRMEGGSFIRDHVYKTTSNSKGSIINFLKPINLTYGLNDDQVLLAIRFLKSSTSDDTSGSGGELAWMYIPLILSGVGYNNVIYDNLEDETRSLESSILKPEELIEKGIYNEIKAGQLTKILTSYKKGEKPSMPGLYYLEDLSPTLTVYSISTNKTNNYSSLIKKIGNETLDGTILLNHLATSTTEDVYIALEYRVRKLTGSSYSDPQVFYYLMKVTPDIIVEDPLYAYNGDAEYINGALNETLEINLEDKFADTTLNSGLKRFMYSKDIALESVENSTLKALVKSENGATIRLTMEITTKDSHDVETTTQLSKIVDLKFEHIESDEQTPKLQDVNVKSILNPSTIADGQIVSVSIIEGDVEIYYNDVLELSTLKAVNKVVSVQPSTVETAYQTPEQWNDYVSISFSEDSKTMRIYPRKDETITIVISHSYVDGSNGQLGVINGDRTYTFVLNEKQQTYAVRFKDGTKTQQTEEFVKTFKNGTKEGDNLKNIELTVDLLSVSGSSGSSSGTIVPDVLQIECTSGIDNLDTTGDHPKGFDYDNKNGTMVIYLLDYIEQDKQVIFTLFTKQGYLAKIILDLEANVVYKAQSPKKSDNGKEVDIPELKAGLSYDLVDLISLVNANGTTEKFGEENELYNITEAKISDETKKFVKIENKKLIIANLLEDKTFKVDYTITFTKTGTGRSFETEGNTFVFSQTYNVKKSITTPEAITKDVEVVAGERHEINIDELSSVIPTGDEYGIGDNFKNLKIKTSTTDPAFKKLEGNFIYTQYVSSVQPVTPLTLVLEVTAIQEGFGEQVYYVNYTISIAPSVKLDITYPDPIQVQDNKSPIEGLMEKKSTGTEMHYEILETIKRADEMGDTLPVTFDSIVDFLVSSPTFAYNLNSTRLNIYQAIAPVAGTEEKKVTYNDKYITKDLKDILKGETSDLIVTIVKLENAIVMCNSSNLAVSSIIPLSGEVKFYVGAGVGIPSKLVLNITYNNVSIEYEIRLQTDAIKVARVLPTTTTSTEQQGDRTITYENIYLDKTPKSDLFANGRILHAEMYDSLSGREGDYYFVFKNGENYYASYPIYIKVDMETKTLDFDLGMGMGEMTFVGAYLTSKFESEKIIPKEGRKLYKEGEVLTDLSAYTNAADKLFKYEAGIPKIYTTSRVQLQYGEDENRVPFRVNYSRYASLINTGIVIKDELGEITENNNILTAVQLPLNNGSTNNNGKLKTFSLGYNYKLAIDVKVEQEITEVNNFKEVNVSFEYDSLVSFLGIHHEITGKAITASDFTASNSNLLFETLYYDGKEKLDGMTDKQFNAIKEFMNSHKEIDKFRKFVDQKNANDDGATNDNIYLFASAIQNANKNTYDYRFIPYGAKNLGDFVLCKVQYSIDETHKATFFVILKIMPDYDVKFAGNASNATIEEDGVVSNRDDIYEVVSTESEKNSYGNFKLTSDGTEGYLSVKHKFGTYTYVERSVSAFTIKMPLNTSIDSINYNDSNNLGVKIFHNYDKKNLYGDDDVGPWKITREEKVNEPNTPITEAPEYIGKEAIEFSEVEHVIFGNQYYMIEAKDNYGFKYRVYFVLVATKQTPSISNRIDIVENGLLDFGVTYQQLSISATKDNATNNINCVINSSMETPNEASGVSLLVFNGITAWQFDKDYVKDNVNVAGEDKTLLKNSVSGWGYDPSANNIVFSDEDKKLLAAPDIESIEIDSVSLYELSGRTPLATLTTVGGATGSNNANWVGPKEEGKEEKYSETLAERPFATGEGYFYNTKTKIKNERELSNPRNPFDKYKDPEKVDAIQENYTKNLWQIPRIENANVYQDSNVANLRIVVKLKYEGTTSYTVNNAEKTRSITEYCEVAAPISVIRESSLQQNDNKVIEDGQSFAIINDNSDQPGFNENQAGGFVIKKVINDTLEVLAPAGETISFNIELKDKEGKIIGEKTQVRVQNSSNNYQRTYYIPLSRYFNQNVEAENTVTISDPSSTSIQFFYISGEGISNVVEVNKPFTIAEIKQDVAYVDNAVMLNNGNCYSISKYYIIKGYYKTSEVDPEPQTEAEKEKFSYRQTANYIVTGRVYELVPTISVGEIIFAMDDENNDNRIPLENWAQKAFTLYKGTTAGEKGGGAIGRGNSIIINDDILDHLSFKLAEDVADSSIGQATIDPKSGEITLGKGFTDDQYINVVISLRVSGVGRGSGEATTDRLKELGTLKLGKKK